MEAFPKGIRIFENSSQVAGKRKNETSVEPKPTTTIELKREKIKEEDVSEGGREEGETVGDRGGNVAGNV